MGKEQRQSVALSNAPESLFSWRMMVRKAPSRGAFIYLSIWLFYPVAKFCIASFPRNVRHPCSPICSALTSLAKTICIRALSLPNCVKWFWASVQTKGSGISYCEGRWVCKNQASRSVQKDFPKHMFFFLFYMISTAKCTSRSKFTITRNFLWNPAWWLISSPYK